LPFALNGNEQKCENEELHQGNKDAGNKNDQGYGPHAGLDEVNNSAHNGIRLGVAQRDNLGNGKYIGGYVKDKGSDNQGPGS
jgi:hypothetical protein